MRFIVIFVDMFLISKDVLVILNHLEKMYFVYITTKPQCVWI